MRIYEVPEDRRAVRLAPQLTGKAQSAYAAMGADYWALKEAILRRYDISEDTYSISTDSHEQRRKRSR